VGPSELNRCEMKWRSSPAREKPGFGGYHYVFIRCSRKAEKLGSMGNGKEELDPATLSVWKVALEGQKLFQRDNPISRTHGRHSHHM